MIEKQRTWLTLAMGLAEIEDLCRNAREEELAAREREATRPSLDGAPALPSPGAQNAPISGLPAPTGDAGDIGADIVQLRAALRSKLVELKASLGEMRTEQEVYYLLFPLVVYADELAQSVTLGRSIAWPPLQAELYEIDNGGEKFFNVLDTLLKREETSPVIFESFYLCLSAGFVGQYQNLPSKIEEYKARLAFRIPTQREELQNSQRTGTPPDIQLARFPLRYYAAAAVFGAACFFTIHLLSLFESAAPG